MWDCRKGKLQLAEIGKFQTAEMSAGERRGYKGGIGIFSDDLIVVWKWKVQ